MIAKPPIDEKRSTGQRAVFVDRDGVINRMYFHPEFGTVDSPGNPDQFTLLPRVGEAIAELNQSGLLVIVVSNQPGIAKGKFTAALLEAMENKLLSNLKASGAIIDAIYNCLHHPEAILDEYRINCECRKPAPGLLLKAARDRGIDLARSYMIGDGVTDIIAGRAVGATTLFVNSRKCYNCDSLLDHEVWPDYVVSDLTEAAKVVRSLEGGDKESALQFVLRCAKNGAV